MSVIDLDRYRERRTVRRIGAVAVAAITGLLVIDYARRAWTMFESGIRLSADLLGPETDDEGETP